MEQEEIDVKLGLFGCVQTIILTMKAVQFLSFLEYSILLHGRITSWERRFHHRAIIHRLNFWEGVIERNSTLNVIINSLCLFFTSWPHAKHAAGWS